MENFTITYGTDDYNVHTTLNGQSYTVLNDLDYIEMYNLQGLYEQLYAIGVGWA